MHSQIKTVLGLALCVFLFIGFSQNNPHVRINTEFGAITLEIYLEKAPITAANFLKYVNNNKFQDAVFYRVVTLGNQPDNDVKIKVIQGSMSHTEDRRGYPPIPHETTEQTGILHTDGVISMARNTPGTAASEFFICLGDQPELDFKGKRNPDGQGFAAFGKVIKGMDVVRKIYIQPAEGQRFNPRIKITNIIREK